MENPYTAETLNRELKNLIVQFGVQATNMAWVKLLTNLESQLKEVLHPVEKPKTPEGGGPPLPVVEPSQPAAMKKVQKVKEPKKPEPEPAPAPVPVKVDDKKMADLNKRKIHKEAVAKRKEVLESQGINGRQLLTADAMKKWIDDGKTYWDIAEQTGVPDTDVSVIAKSFGLQSKVSKLIAFKK
jgi:hypothetical protein